MLADSVADLRVAQPRRPVTLSAPPGPVIVTIASGTLTLFEAHHHGCQKSRVGPGQGFIENGGHVHLAHNEGSEDVVIYATFLARTGTTEFLKPAADPGTCHV